MAIITTQVIYGVMLMCLLSPLAVFGYEIYTKKIPNAKYVKNPESGEMHPGVGHFAEGGGGPRNCFGRAFKKANLEWSKVCRLDSDGDGKMNGEELGDPTCKWTEGSVIKLTIENITHPGLCTPLTSEICKHFNAENSDCKTPNITKSSMTTSNVTTTTSDASNINKTTKMTTTKMTTTMMTTTMMTTTSDASFTLTNALLMTVSLMLAMS